MKFRERCIFIDEWLNHLKTKIVNFDIKPSKPVMLDLQMLADGAVVAGNNVEAINYFTKILAIDHRNSAALLGLIRSYLNTGKISASLKFLRRALRYYPDDHAFYHLLGCAQAKNADLRASAKAYQHALRLNPDLIGVQHLLDAVQQKTTAIAPREYVVNVFNYYSSFFEKSLVDALEYRAHIDLPNFIISVMTTPKSVAAILDLGCGTGLLGQEFLQHFQPTYLIGVDLAPNMIAKAEEKAIYTELHNAEIIEYLQQTNNLYDIVGATDVFVYVGDLTTIFAQVYKSLKPGGYFGFSLETLAKGDFKLLPTGRYQHSLGYIQRLSSNFNFSRIYSKLIDLRKEHGKMVPGYLLLLQK